MKKLDYTSVVCIVKRDNKYLFCKREDNGLWVLPGGRIENGEASEKAATRELFEETGLKAKKVKLRASWLVKSGTKWRNTAVYEAQVIEGELTSSWETPEVVFMNKLEIEKRIPVYIKELLKEIEQQKLYFSLKARKYEYWVILRYIYGRLKRTFRRT